MDKKKAQKNEGRFLTAEETRQEKQLRQKDSQKYQASVIQYFVNHRSF